MSFNHMSIMGFHNDYSNSEILRSEYCIVANETASGDNCYNSNNRSSTQDIKFLAGFKIFAFVMLQMWRKKSKEIKKFMQSLDDLRKSNKRMEKQNRVYSSLIRIEQTRNDELTDQLNRTLHYLKYKTILCEKLSKTLSNLKTSKALLEQELKKRYEEYDGLHEVFAQTKTELFRSMMKQRNLQAQLCREQRTVQSLENQNSLLVSEISSQNREHRNTEESFLSQLNKKDCEINKLKQLFEKYQYILINIQKNLKDPTKHVCIQMENDLRVFDADPQKNPLSLSQNLGKCWNRFIEYPKSTLNCIYLLTYYLLPALPPPPPPLSLS